MVFPRVLSFRRSGRSADGRVEGRSKRPSKKSLFARHKPTASSPASVATTTDSSEAPHRTSSSPLSPERNSILQSEESGGTQQPSLNNTTLSSTSSWMRHLTIDEKEPGVPEEKEVERDEPVLLTDRVTRSRSSPHKVPIMVRPAGSSVGMPSDSEQESSILFPELMDDEDEILGQYTPSLASNPLLHSSEPALVKSPPSTPPRYPGQQGHNRSTDRPHSTAATESLEDYLQLQPSQSYDAFSQTVVAGNVIMTSNSLLLSSVINLSVLKHSDTFVVPPPTSKTDGATSNTTSKFLFAPPAAKTVRDSLHRHLHFHLTRPAVRDGNTDPLMMPASAADSIAPANPIQDEEDEASQQTGPAMIPPSSSLTPTTVHTVAQDCLKANNVEAAISVYQAYLENQQQEQQAPSGGDSSMSPSAAAHQFVRSPVSSFSMLEQQTQSHFSGVSQSCTGDADAQRADTLGKLAILHLYSGQHKQALTYANQSAHLWKQASNRPLSTAMAVMLVGLIQFATSRAGKALKAWREAMQLCCVALGYDHPIVAVLLNNIGVLHYDSGDSMAALRALEESLSLQRSMLKTCVASVHVDHVLFQMATTMGNLALALEMNERYDRAISLMQESQALFESIETTLSFPVKSSLTRGEDDMEAMPVSELVADNLDRLLLRRENFLDRGRNEQSLLQAEDENMSLTDGSTTDGERSILGNSVDNGGHYGILPSSLLATAADNQDYLLLGPVFKEWTPRERVREIVLTWFGRSCEGFDRDPYASWDNQSVTRDVLPFVPLTFLSSLSSEVAKKGLPSSTGVESEPSADRSSTVGQPTSPEDIKATTDTEVLHTELNLNEAHLQAMNFVDQGAIAEALDIFMKALKILQARYGNNHHLVGSALHNIGMVHLFAEEYLQAYGIFKEAARIRSEALGPEHPDVAASTVKIGLLQYAAMDIAAAARTLSDVRETYLKSVGYGHPHLAKIMNNIGVLRYEEGDIVGATRAFEIAYEYQRRLVEDCPGESSVAEIAMGCTLANIGFLYHRQDELVSAVRLFEEARSTLMRHLYPYDPKVMMVQQNIEYLVGRGVDMQAPCEEGCQLTPAARTCLMQFSWGGLR